MARGLGGPVPVLTGVEPRGEIIMGGHGRGRRGTGKSDTKPLVEDCLAATRCQPVARPSVFHAARRRRGQAQSPTQAGLNMNRVNPEMLALARESRGLTQPTLSEMSSVDQGNISKYERGLLDVSATAIEELAGALRYPVHFFYRDEEIRGLNSGCFYHRERQSLPVSELRVIEAKANILRIHAAILLRGADIDHDNRIVRRDINDGETAQDIARYIRAIWGLPIGPVKNLVRAIERAGGIVFRCHFGTRKIDAVSQWCQGLPPMLFVNAEAPGDRARWTLSHELGHIVMHRIPTPDAEREADLFASEFLMPARDIAADLDHFSLARAATLKLHWKVSMAAITMQAHRLEKISDRQKADLFKKLSVANMRTKEPDTIPIEQPTVMSDLINLHLNELGCSVADLARLLALEEEEFRSLYLENSDNRMGLRVVS